MQVHNISKRILGLTRLSGVPPIIFGIEDDRFSIHLLDSHLDTSHNHKTPSYQPTRNLGVGVDNVAELENVFVDNN